MRECIAMELKDGNIRSISVSQWHRLALEGSELPIRLRLDGDSMRPLIRRQTDAVTVVPLKREPRRRDIVLFADGSGRYVVHRVLKCENGTVTTLGDNCIFPDCPLPTECVWGLVTRIERSGRVYLADSRFVRLLGTLAVLTLPVRRGRRRISSLLKKVSWGIRNRINRRPPR